MKRRPFPTWVLAIALVLLVLTPGAAAVVIAITTEQRRVRAALRSAAAARGVSPDVVDALAYVESRWRMGATNLTGPDGARGGAWGPTQITEKTARAHGYTGDMAALTQNAALAGEWTARILAARPGGAPASVEDAAAWWNAGRTSFASLGPDHITRRDYVPKAQQALSIVRGNPVSA